MELSLSGNALKTFARSVTCLARVGNDLAIQSSPSQLALHTLNSSRSAFNSITFKPGFFDIYTISGNQVECSVLLKAVCSVLRTPVASIDSLSIKLPDSDASKVQWTLECFNGMRKTYWITCNVEPNIQQLSLDRRKFPSNFVVKPRDLNRLLTNFQSSLQEITIIATEPNSLPCDVASEIGGKAVELRSYIDPTKGVKAFSIFTPYVSIICITELTATSIFILGFLIAENDSSLHTQLWIDPMEEFVQYTHTGDPVDVTFGVKELKAFLSFCEGCEVDIHLFFEKAGEPILMAPKFGVDDASNSNFDATFVLATMLTSQLHESHPQQSAQADTTRHVGADNGTASQGQVKTGANISEHPSDHTRIWSDLSGSAAKNGNGNEGRQVREEQNLNASEQREINRISAMHISKSASDRENEPVNPNTFNMEKDCINEHQDINGQGVSQRHLSNWVDANEDDDDDEEEEAEIYVQSTPPYH
ncbi:hypothetical protein F8388_018450 [Cannabis sativa]|uniref:Cell cycle checkpoint control protein RAD9A n=1 Tax=Cannabis sativa TaxID=3483 RepID=A0A7J6F237_CANSA|nr:hypothetical protein F8388_018450 [Cannabis sativa]